jgi:hypothetical protein
MKKWIKVFLVISLACSSIYGEQHDDLQDYATTTDDLWRTGSGAHDGSYTSISAAMIGWGVGLAVGIAILCAVLHQSKGSSSHSD